MPLTFRVHRRRVWRLIDDEGAVVAQGEPYTREADVVAALNWVTGASPDRLSFRKWQDGLGRWHWGLLALEGTDPVAFGGPFDAGHPC